MQQKSWLAGILMLALAPAALAVPDENGSLVDPGAAAAGVSADAAMSARLHYNVGFERFEKAKQLEMQAASASGGAQLAQDAQVRQGFADARERFRAAVAAAPDMRQAWNLIGYTSRRLGDYEESLQAYDRALALAPDYPEAIEYRAELLLMTGRFDEVKQAHAQLQQSSPSYADMLKASMQQWVTRKDAPGADAPGRDAFVAWVRTL